MLLSCPICMVSFDQASEIFCLPCGHLYHAVCTMHWFERTKTCPQCRKPTTEKKCIKVYPHVANVESQNPSQLTEAIDNLNLEIKTLRKAHNEADHSNATLKSELLILQESKQAIAEDLVRATSHVSLLKKQLRCLKTTEKELTDMKMMKEKAESELKVYKNVHRVLNGSLSEAQEALTESASSYDISSIFTMCNSLKKELVNIKAQKVHLKRTLEHEKTRFKDSFSKLENQQKEEVDKLNIKINELEEEIEHLQAINRKREKNPNHYFDDLGVNMLEIDDSSQISSESGTSTKPSSSQSSVSSNKTTTSTCSKTSSSTSTKTLPSKRRVLTTSTNTNKVKVPLQKSNTIFGTSRLSSSGSHGLLKRMYNNAANLPDGMAYDGMGRTVRAEIGFKPAPVKKFKRV